MMENTKPEDDVDKCVICGIDTPYTINTHIDQRKHYIEGAGQVCGECHEKIYKK